jgi:hypothetical protein
MFVIKRREAVSNERTKEEYKFTKKKKKVGGCAHI